MPTTYIFTYQTICQINSKSYIGAHCTNNISDGYIGCGVSSQKNANRNMPFHRAVRKYGYKNFIRYELDFYDSWEDALLDEKYMVNKEWVKDKNNYNAAIGGEGSTTAWMDEKQKKQWKNNIKEKIKIFYENGGREKVIEGIKNGRKANLFGSRNGSYGKPHVRRRNVIQYNKDMSFVKLHDSLTSAAIEVGSVPANINACCNGKHLTCKGHVFRFEAYSELESSTLVIKTNRPTKEEYTSARINKIKNSFLTKGRKNSIVVENIKTGEVLHGITRLVNLYNKQCFQTIKKELINNGSFKDWIKQ